MRLIDYLPEDYKKSVPVVELQDTLDVEANSTMLAAEDLQKQLHLESATWGLAAWETMYGLPVDWRKNEASRRAAILARMGGTDTTKVITIQDVAEKFLQGKAVVFEVNEEYRFEVFLLEVLQKGQNIEELQAAIDEIKPAHLAYTIILKYNTWGEVKKKLTWGELLGKKWGEVKGERL